MSPQPAGGLSCRGLSKQYSTRGGIVAALVDVSFRVAPEEFVCIVGPSGCGKSTLLKILAELMMPTAGEMVFDEPSSTSQPRNALVFQEHGLFPWMTVLDNVAFALEMRGMGKAQRSERVQHFLGQIGLGQFLERYPHELSVGMRQRVAIARAFLADPQVLLMDEPFSALDAQSKLIMQEELLRIWKDNRKMVIYVTHDIEEAVLLGDRILIMSGHPGRIQEDIRIPLERPRDLRDRERAEVREITWHIWKAIEAEVRKGLRAPA